MRLRNLWPRLLILLATIIWGTSFFILKNTTEQIPPLFILALRFSASAVLLTILFFSRIAASLDKAILLRGFLLGLFLFLSYVFQTYGLMETTPGKNAFLTTVYVILVPFLGYFFTKKLPGIYHLIAAAVCMCGIGLIVLDGRFSIAKGDYLTLVGGLGFAIHILLLNRYSEKHDIFALTMFQFLFCGLFCWIGTLLFETIPPDWHNGTIPSLLYLSVFCTTGALLFQSIGQKFTPSAQVAILLSLEAVFGVLFSVLFYRERPSLRMIFGFLLVFVAILLSELGGYLFSSRKKKSELDVAYPETDK